MLTWVNPEQQVPANHQIRLIKRSELGRAGLRPLRLQPQMGQSCSRGLKTEIPPGDVWLQSVIRPAMGLSPTVSRAPSGDPALVLSGSQVYNT